MLNVVSILCCRFGLLRLFCEIVDQPLMIFSLKFKIVDSRLKSPILIRKIGDSAVANGNLFAKQFDVSLLDCC